MAVQHSIQHALVAKQARANDVQSRSGNDDEVQLCSPGTGLLVYEM